MEEKNITEWYLHSKCCAADWDLKYDSDFKVLEVVCGKCRKSSGILIAFELPDSMCKCASCQN